MEVVIQDEHAELLCHLVEASRNVSTKEVFMALHPCCGETLGNVMHAGLPNRQMKVYLGDVEELIDLGLLSPRHISEHQINFDVSSAGFQAYEQIRQVVNEPVEVVESEIRNYIDSIEFHSRYPSAYTKWRDAESALWLRIPANSAAQSD
jgi:hypothetical protein